MCDSVFDCIPFVLSKGNYHLIVGIDVLTGWADQAVDFDRLALGEFPQSTVIRSRTNWSSTG